MGKTCVFGSGRVNVNEVGIETRASRLLARTDLLDDLRGAEPDAAGDVRGDGRQQRDGVLAEAGEAVFVVVMGRAWWGEGLRGVHDGVDGVGGRTGCMHAHTRTYIHNV